MTSHTIAPPLGHRSWWFRLAAILAVVAGYVVFGWSLRFPAFLAFTFGVGALGALDWRHTTAQRVVIAWSMALSALLFVAAQLVADGALGVAGLAVGGLIAGSALLLLHRLYPIGFDVTDVIAGSFVAFALSSFGWRAPVVAFVVAAAMSGTVAGYRIFRSASRAGIVVPFAALLAASSVLTALAMG